MFFICFGALSTRLSEPTFSMKFRCNLRRNHSLGFFSELSLENLISPFQFFVVPSAHNKDFASHSKIQPFLELMLASRTSSSKNGFRFNETTKMVPQKTEKNFFRTTTELTILKASLQCVLQPS